MIEEVMMKLAAELLLSIRCVALLYVHIATQLACFPLISSIIC